MAASAPRPPYQLLGVFLVLALAFLGIEYRYGRDQKAEVEKEVGSHLLDIATVKVKLLSTWRQHRLGEMQAIMASPGAMEAFGRLAGGQGSPAERERMEVWFAGLCRDLPLANITLADARGKVVVTVGKRFGDDREWSRLAAEAAAWQQPVLSDFHFDRGGDAIHLGLLAPLRKASGAPIFGILGAAIDPAAEVYPVLQTWLGPGATGETLLVRREGADALSLNPLRYQPDSALRLRLPLANRNTIAAQAIGGARGILQGVDYRGVPVLAAALPVSGTDWFLLVKMDRREALAPVTQGWMSLGILAIALILAAGGIVAWLWRLRELRFYRAHMQAEETLRTLLEASPAAIVALDPRNCVVAWNPAAEHLFGWTTAEVIGRLLPCVPPELQGNIEALREKLRLGGSVCGLPVEGLRKDGSRIRLSLSRSLLRDERGEVTGDMAVLSDITAQKAAEEALQVSEALFRATFDQAAVGMNHVSLDGRFLRVNRRFCEITGYPEAELLQLGYRDITHPADLVDDDDHRRQLLDNVQASYSREKRYLRKDGSTVWVQRTASVVRAPSGEPLHLMAAVQDITERVRAREELRQSEARLRQLVEHAPEGIAVVCDLRYRYLNPALSRLFGEGAADLLGRRVVDRLQPDDRALAERLWQRLMAGEAVPPSELRGTTLAGRPILVEVSAAPIEYDGQPAALVFYRDITERRRDEEERLRLELQLQHSQKMESIGRLAGGVSHDFNNLLTIINGYCEMLLAEEGLAESTREPLEEIRAAGTRASSLTQQLLAFSRKQIAEPRVLNLNGVVQESERMLRRLIGENVHITTGLAGDLGMVIADRGQMHQVLMNLVVNARDAMPDGGTIAIQTSNVQVDSEGAAGHPEARPGAFVTLSVTDNGIGMTAETKRQVFEPFFSTKPRSAGTGLGLSTVYGIVKHSGGWIEVRSQLNRGSTFRVYLPLTAAPAEEAPAESGTSAPAGGAPADARGAETVLVVEDQGEVRRMVLAILRQNGYRLLEAADGTEAVSMSERYDGPIDLMVTDVVMPGMNGRELAERMLRLRPAMKILYISGYSADVLAPEGVLAPETAYLAKPFSPAELSRKIREVLGERVTGQILVIDDEAPVRTLIDRLLTDSGYHVFLAPNGVAGLSIARDHAIDVVITDLVMPEGEGLETIPKLRALRPEAHILAISGAFGGQYLKAAKLLGADYALAKPLDREDLLEAVRALLARRDLDRQPVESVD
ncbi:MAG TPA: PAS domain S-box protein [Bryobacteraceae bacterium]|nr:PAS domain S-box protein [Bryobacteraceae bacterium]